MIYGSGSIKKNGIYEQVMELLKANGKVVVEDGGVMPNPTVEKLAEGVRIARDNKNNCGLGFSVDFHGARAENVKRHNIDI